MHDIHNHTFPRLFAREATKYHDETIEVINSLVEDDVPKYVNREANTQCSNAVAECVKLAFTPEHSWKLPGDDFAVAVSIGDMSAIDRFDKIVLLEGITEQMEERGLYGFRLDFANCGCVVTLGRIEPETHDLPGMW